MHARLVGVGSFVPDRAVDNVRVTTAIPSWPPEKIHKKTGILERRFLWDFNDATGAAIVPPDDGSVWPRSNTDMCEVALRKALEMASLNGRDLDAILLVSLTTDEMSFCHDAIELHKRFGCRPETEALVIDSGCGGAQYILGHARKMVEGGQYTNVAVVASHFTSAYMNREAFTDSESVNGHDLNACLTMYLFGDGAGAMILSQSEVDDSAFLYTSVGADSSELVLRRGGGAQRPPYPGRSKLVDHTCIINGKLVAKKFPAYMNLCINKVLQDSGMAIDDFDRYYLHQANKLLVEGYAKEIGIPMNRFASHMEKYGNTSAAGTLILLSEDIENGVVSLGSGQIVLMAAIGAGVHYGANIIRL